jgi:ABC-2 type transport system permease protein
LVAVVKMLWSMIYVLMPLKALNVNGIGWGVILPDILGILVYAAIWLPLGIYIYAKKVNAGKTLAETSDTFNW